MMSQFLIKNILVFIAVILVCVLLMLLDNLSKQGISFDSDYNEIDNDTSVGFMLQDDTDGQDVTTNAYYVKVISMPPSANLHFTSYTGGELYYSWEE